MQVFFVMLELLNNHFLLPKIAGSIYCLVSQAILVCCTHLNGQILASNVDEVFALQQT
jgi:hypothetical protein